MQKFLLVLVITASTNGFCIQPRSTPTSATPAPLWLGDPDVDEGKARAGMRDREAEQLRWELITTIGDYERIGQKDPRWDADVRLGLEEYAKSLVQSVDWTAHTAAAKAATRRALDAGCKDPLVVYANLRLQHDPDPIDYADLARVYARAETDLERSGYSPLRKLYASLRAAEYAVKSCWPLPDTHNKTRAPADGTNLEVSVNHAIAHLAEVLHDPAAQTDSVVAVAAELFDISERERDKDWIEAPLAKSFDEGSLDDLGDTVTANLVEGMFWKKYSWHHRFDAKHKDDSEEEGEDKWQAGRQKAWTCLKRAYALNPSDPHVCVYILRLELDAGEDREEMEKWFRRAMDADPDSYPACKAKLDYLQPQWYGDAEAMLAFGHECIATANWTTGLPCILVEAHYMLARQATPPLLYWNKPEVRKDMEAFFLAAEAAQPGSVRYRSMHAYYAFTTQQWKKADELFTALGDKPDLGAMGIGQQQIFLPRNYENMRRTAAERAKADTAHAPTETH